MALCRFLTYLVMLVVFCDNYYTKTSVICDDKIIGIWFTFDDVVDHKLIITFHIDDNNNYCFIAYDNFKMIMAKSFNPDSDTIDSFIFCFVSSTVYFVFPPQHTFIFDDGFNSLE